MRDDRFGAAGASGERLVPGTAGCCHLRSGLMVTRRHWALIYMDNTEFSGSVIALRKSCRAEARRVLLRFDEVPEIFFPRRGLFSLAWGGCWPHMGLLRSSTCPQG